MTFDIENIKKRTIVLTLLKRLSGLLILLLIVNQFAHGQIGGKGVYTFLEMPNSARIAATGSNYLPIYDGDINLGLANPSLVNEEMNNQIGLSFVDFYSDISTGFAGYSHTFDKAGSFSAYMQFINYGKFERADISGQRNGEFTAGEYAFHVGWGRSLTPNFKLGANIKGIWANYDRYKSTGIAVDVAASYFSDDERFTTSLIISNIGRQITAFSSTGIEPINYDIKLGISREFKHVPFKIFVLTQHLQVWDLRYDDPEDPAKQVDPVTGKVEQDSDIEVFADNLMRHFTFGGEFSVTENFHLRGGYNYQRRQELKVPSKMGTVGFSWGFGFRISKFHLNYARSTYHLNGSPNYISLTTNLDDFFNED